MAVQVKKVASFFAEKIDPKKKNARVLAPLNANQDGPFHFFAKNVIAATKTTKQEKRNVVLALAHDGLKFVEVASTEKLDENAVNESLGNATLYTWDTIVRFRIVGALQEFRFSWDDRSVASDDIKKRTKDFRLQTIDFDAIDHKIGKIVKDIEANKLLSSLGGGAISVRPRSGSKSARGDGSSSGRKNSSAKDSPREASGSSSSKRKGSDDAENHTGDNAEEKKKDKKKIKITSAPAESEEKPQEAEPAPEEKKDKKDKKKKEAEPEPEPEAEPEPVKEPEAEPEPEPEPVVEEKKKDKKKKKEVAAEEQPAEEAPKEEEPAAEEAPAEEAAEEQKDKKKKKKKKVESSEEADE